MHIYAFKYLHEVFPSPTKVDEETEKNCKKVQKKAIGAALSGEY
jgi:hypothetical protein